MRYVYTPSFGYRRRVRFVWTRRQAHSMEARACTHTPQYPDKKNCFRADVALVFRLNRQSFLFLFFCITVISYLEGLLRGFSLPQIVLLEIFRAHLFHVAYRVCYKRRKKHFEMLIIKITYIQNNKPTRKPSAGSYTKRHNTVRETFLHVTGIVRGHYSKQNSSTA